MEDKKDEVVVEELLIEETAENTKKNRKVRVRKDKVTNALVIPLVIPIKQKEW